MVLEPVIPANTTEIRLRGRVQGVGMRPAIWRLASALALRGEVFNDSEGVIIRAAGPPAAITALIDQIRATPPPLSRIDQIETTPFFGPLPQKFRITASTAGPPQTQITPDAAICPACAAETADTAARRARYPFTNCTNCGPRLSIITAIPYDRANTTMAAFAMCADCAAEYQNPADRRFHAVGIACPACGPRAKLIRLDGAPIDAPDPIGAAATLLKSGGILAIKGLGGYQLAADATNPATIARLRAAKNRDAKPFALMARDIPAIRKFCTVSAAEAALITSPEAPIVLLDRENHRLPESLAPGLRIIGFMLPTTPLHFLLLNAMHGPLVMTSGNVSGTPQVTDDAQLRETLAGIASHALVHDRRIASRLDDSVVRIIAGRPRLLRRARGYAPAAIALPKHFARAPDLLAMGAELKNTFCLLKNGQAILSQHIGDLEDAQTFDDYEKTLALYAAMFNHTPTAIVIDRHPGYLSSRLGRAMAQKAGIPLMQTQHHHAHIAACLAANARPLAASPVLGIVLDGAGLGDDGTIWGGEFLSADYRSCHRLASLAPVPVPGGEQAMREPWRNLYAHLRASIGWEDFSANHANLDVFADLAARPLTALDQMMRQNINTPLASSCGRLFDAVAAALKFCRDRQSYEGQAAALLEAAADMASNPDGYPFSIDTQSGLPKISPTPMWRALLADLQAGTPASLIAARFHTGLAGAIAAMAQHLADGAPKFDTIALSGGCFQNRILAEAIEHRLASAGFTILSHAEIPANDGGLSLGQAAIAAALMLRG